MQSQGRKPVLCDCMLAGESNQNSEKCGVVIYKASGKCNPRAGNRTLVIVREPGGNKIPEI